MQVQRTSFHHFLQSVTSHYHKPGSFGHCHGNPHEVPWQDSNTVQPTHGNGTDHPRSLPKGQSHFHGVATILKESRNHINRFNLEKIKSLFSAARKHPSKFLSAFATRLAFL